MKNIYLFLFSLMFFNSAFSQTNIGLAKTAAHKNIPGTKVWLIPPVNFELTDRYKGFSNKTDPYSSIMLTEIPAAYEKISPAFSKTGPTAHGMNITDIESCVITGKRGCALITIIQAAQGHTFGKHMLLLGDDNGSIMITATYLKDSANIGKNLKTSIRSINYDERQVIDARGSLDFAFDESKSIFKYDNVMGSIISFSAKTTAGDKNDDIKFMAAKSFSNIVFQDKKTFCLGRIKELPYQIVDVDKNKGFIPIEIDGLKGYEIYATASRTDISPKESLYQAILFDDSNATYYIMAAVYKYQIEKNITAIKMLVESFKRKTK